MNRAIFILFFLTVSTQQAFSSTVDLDHYEIQNGGDLTLNGGAASYLPFLKGSQYLFTLTETWFTGDDPYYADTLIERDTRITFQRLEDEDPTKELSFSFYSVSPSFNLVTSYFPEKTISYYNYNYYGCSSTDYWCQEEMQEPVLGSISGWVSPLDDEVEYFSLVNYSSTFLVTVTSVPLPTSLSGMLCGIATLVGCAQIKRTRASARTGVARTRIPI